MEANILASLKSIKPLLCVMATVDEKGQPECAVLAYVVHDDLSLTICTQSTSRKWENLAQQDKVALTMGWDFVQPNIQYEGLAQRVETQDEHAMYEKIYYSVHPELEKFKTRNTVFIKITPKWIRYTDLTEHPPKIIEKSL